ncbi:hypothetical protein SteCoe_26016 [Stentor coeruleus]|uniref:RING-type domain-containing protein n=1 Tax=Stentor coeruleus TaxID=5963 RepID=A0A1R2BDU7_9CILI|nr:hypothetical protein SteCoe_26016 [Stentor coeruleus]
MLLAKDCISLVLPDSQINAKIKYLDKSIFLQTLELENTLHVGFYKRLNLTNLQPFAILNPLEASVDPFEKIAATVQYLFRNGAVISATSLELIDYVFILYPTESLSQISLSVLSLKDLLGDDVADYIQYIENIRLTYKQIHIIYSNALETEKFIGTESDSLEKKCEKASEQCKDLSKILFNQKQEVCQLSEEFDTLEQEFKDLECLHCKCNLRNVLFLPCGHLTLCNDCLLTDFNITPNLPIIDSKLKCMKCKKLVRQALISITFSNK